MESNYIKSLKLDQKILIVFNISSTKKGTIIEINEKGLAIKDKNDVVIFCPFNSISYIKVLN